MKFQVYQDAEGKWRWRAVANNNRIVADSGQGYTTRGDTFKAIRRFMQLTHSASIDF